MFVRSSVLDFNGSGTLNIVETGEAGIGLLCQLLVLVIRARGPSLTFYKFCCTECALTWN